MVSSLSVNCELVTVNMTKVTNAQVITISLNNVSDKTNVGNVSLPMGVLEGDTTGNRQVNSSDIAQTQSQSGQPVTADNFREDVTVDGLVNSSDIAFVQSQSGTALPAPPSPTSLGTSPSAVSTSPAVVGSRGRKTSSSKSK